MDKLTQLFALVATFVTSTEAFSQNSKEPVTLVDARDHMGSIADYIADRKSKLVINGKQTDMFGLPQDPKKAKALQVAKRPEKEPVKKPTIPLQAVLDALPLTLIDPTGNRVVLDGSPPIKAGESLELTIGRETVVLRLEGVRSNGAYFRDMETKKLGLRSLTKLPAGIQRGGEKAKGPKEIQRIDLNQSQTIKVDLNLANGGFAPN